MKFILTTICRILSYVLYTLTLTAAYGGHINPHLWATPSIFTLALPYLAMLTMLAVVGWALSRKLISCGLGVAVLVICWAPIMQAVPFREEAFGRTGRPIHTSHLQYTRRIRQERPKFHRRRYSKIYNRIRCRHCSGAGDGLSEFRRPANYSATHD